MQYVIGSMKEFDFPSNNVFIDERLYNDRSYSKIKGHPFFKAIDGHALRANLIDKFREKSFKSVPIDKLKGKMLNRIPSFNFIGTQFFSTIEEHPQLSFFLSYDKIFNLTRFQHERLSQLQNLFIFSKEMSKEEITYLRSLGAEDYDHLNQDDLQQVVAFSLRNLYQQMTADSDIDNQEELIDTLSLKFKIKRPVLRAIFNDELFPSQEIKATVKDGSTFNEAEIDYLHNIFFKEVIKNEETLQDYLENKNDCYNYLNNLLTNRTLMVYNKEIVLKEIAKYITKNGEN